MKLKPGKTANLVFVGLALSVIVAFFAAMMAGKFFCAGAVCDTADFVNDDGDYVRIEDVNIVIYGIGDDHGTGIIAGPGHWA